MTFVCDGCMMERNWDTEYGMAVVVEKKGFQRFCRYCRHGRVNFPDVYWDGKPEENLADGPDGKPRTFLSRGQKAQYLKERGLQEAGDTIRGSREFVAETPRVDSREQVRQALARVKSMGRDVRRQAYLKIIKEAQQHA